MRLADKVAIVTGAAGGIGFAYARRFLAEGARVVVADVVDPVPAAGKLGAADRVLGVRTDVSDATSTRAMVDAAVGRFGRVDVTSKGAVVAMTRALARELGPDGITVLFLASDDSAFMSGQTLIVDGGSVFSTL